MIHLSLIGIGTGNPKHLTLEAVEAIRAQDLILIPNKGAGKDDLAGLRRQICADTLSHSPHPAAAAGGDAGRAASGPLIVEFDLPVRDPDIADYRARVDHWHDAIAQVWRTAIEEQLVGWDYADQGDCKVGFLVWGDPSLYDSTMRIAERLGTQMEMTRTVYPGVTSIQALTAAHGVPLNDIGGPVLITTGRRLRQEGWPVGVDRVVVMLDADCAFQNLCESRLTIHWTAYAGMENEISISGPLPEVSADILRTRRDARAAHGWIMDIYLLHRSQ